MYFCKIENFAYGEINEQSFSDPRPRVVRKLQLLAYNFSISIFLLMLHSTIVKSHPCLLQKLKT